MSAPWDPYRHLAAARERMARRERVAHDANPIVDKNAHRTWKPGERCTDDQLDGVFMLLDSAGEMTQDEIARELSDLLGLKMGTARGAVSGALFALQEIDLAEFTGRFDETENGGRSRVWRLKEGG